LKEKYMKKSIKRSGQFLVPGEKLGVIEEFTPDTGTYEDQGIVYSNIVGRLLLDILNKKISIYPLGRIVDFPRIKSVVMGRIFSVQSKRAVLRIFKMGKKTTHSYFTGILHVSEVSPGYVEVMFDAVKPNDIIRAKVISDKNRTYWLSTMDDDLGVIYALCSFCGHMLTSIGRKMKCTECGKIEKRKVALDFKDVQNGVENNES
jgi:exosome complex component CSL4